jgi:dihydroflavonol-4-reductase
VLTAVTGASGHLGANLTRALLARGHRVRAVGRRRRDSLEGLPIQWATADVLDPAALRAAFDGAETVFHLAARISVTGDPDGRVWATNVAGVRNAAEAALGCGVRRFVHCSSVHAFDLERCGGHVDERSPRAERPGLPVYDRSKAAGEAELRMVVERGLDAVVVHPTGVVGPCDFEPSRMGKFFVALRRRRLPALVAGGFDWVDVRDVADTLIAAGVRGRSGEGYLVSGQWRSLGELAGIAADATGVPPPGLTVPMSVARVWGPVGTMLSRRWDSPLLAGSESLHALRFRGDVSRQKAVDELGHNHRPVEESVRDLYEWFDRRKAR